MRVQSLFESVEKRYIKAINNNNNNGGGDSSVVRAPDS